MKAIYFPFIIHYIHYIHLLSILYKFYYHLFSIYYPLIIHFVIHFISSFMLFQLLTEGLNMVYRSVSCLGAAGVARVAARELPHPGELT